MTPVLKTGNAQAFFGSNPKPDAKARNEQKQHRDRSPIPQLGNKCWMCGQLWHLNHSNLERLVRG